MKIQISVKLTVRNANLKPIKDYSLKIIVYRLKIIVSTLLPHWYKISKSYLVPVPNY